MKFFWMLNELDDNSVNISSVLNLEKGYISWIGGRRFSVTVDEPIKAVIDEEDEGEMLPFIRDYAEFMSFDMIDALLEVGVDNLDLYDALITETRTGKKHTNYKGVNIIGKVRAVDFLKSKGKDFGIHKNNTTTMIFKKLILDESKIQNLKLFRLAESTSTIIVNEVVKNHLEKKLKNKGADKLLFIDV